MDKRHCSGCYCDDYNYGLGGAKECWHLKDAKLVMRKLVHIDQRPPWTQKATKLPNCYVKQRFVIVSPNRTK